MKMLALVLAGLLGGCGTDSSTDSPTTTTITPAPTQAPDPAPQATAQPIPVTHDLSGSGSIDASGPKLPEHMTDPGPTIVPQGNGNPTASVIRETLALMVIDGVDSQQPKALLDLQSKYAVYDKNQNIPNWQKFTITSGELPAKVFMLWFVSTPVSVKQAVWGGWQEF